MADKAPDSRDRGKAASRTAAPMSTDAGLARSRSYGSSYSLKWLPRYNKIYF